MSVNSTDGISDMEHRLGCIGGAVSLTDDLQASVWNAGSAQNNDHTDTYAPPEMAAASDALSELAGYWQQLPLKAFQVEATQKVQ